MMMWSPRDNRGSRGAMCRPEKAKGGSVLSQEGNQAGHRDTIAAMGLTTVVIVGISLSTKGVKVNVTEIFSRVEIVSLEELR